MRIKQKKFLIVFIFSIIYILLILFDPAIYSFFAIQTTDLIKNIIFFIQQDLIFFPIVFLFGLICIYFRKEKKSMKNKKLLAFVISVAVSMLFVFILKTFVYKPRPDILLGVDSFPSGHSTLLFTLFPFIKENPKSLKTIYIIFASLILLSRFLFGYHYLSDLFIGAMWGYSVSFLTKSILIKSRK